MKEKLTFEAFYPDPPERVWQALTDPSALARWLMPTTFKPLLGFRFRFEGLDRGNRSTVEGEVLELEEGTRLSYTWDDGEDDTPGVVCWTLQPRDGGTHLTLEHRPAAQAPSFVLIEAAANWRYALHACLPALMLLLEKDGRRPKAPMVYVEEELQPEAAPRRRAGFRQEEPTCLS